MREKLKQLEATEDFVFHGSAAGDITLFEPRQAYSFGKPDGNPAVFAAAYLAPPIFMAVLGSRHVGGWGRKDGTRFGFYIRESDWEKAHREQWTGNLYVFDKGNFKRRGNWEWISVQPVTPLEVHVVGLADLPPEITIMSDAEFARYYDKHA